MNKYLKAITTVMLVISCLAIGVTIDKVFLADNTTQPTVSKSEEATDIAIVNTDKGVTVDGKTINYANDLISKEDYNFDGLSNSEKGIENGTYGAFIVVPSDFSESIDSLNSTPKNSVISYEINPKLSPEAELEVTKKINEFENYLDAKIGKMYLGSLLNQFQDGQESANTAIENNKVDLATLNNISALDLTTTIKIDPNEKVEDTIAKLDLTEENNKNATIVNTIKTDYANLQTTVATDVANVKNNYITVSNDVKALQSLGSSNGYALQSIELTRAYVLNTINNEVNKTSDGSSTNEQYVLVKMPVQATDPNTSTTVNFSIQDLKNALTAQGFDSSVVNNVKQINVNDNSITGLSQTDTNKAVSDDPRLANLQKIDDTIAKLVSDTAATDGVINSFAPETTIADIQAQIDANSNDLTTVSNNVTQKATSKQAEYDAYSNEVQTKSDTYTTNVLQKVTEDKNASDQKLANGLATAKSQLQKSLNENQANFGNFISVLNGKNSSTSKTNAIINKINTPTEITTDTTVNNEVQPTNTTDTTNSGVTTMYIIDGLLILLLLIAGGTLIYKNQKKNQQQPSASA